MCKLWTQEYIESLQSKSKRYTEQQSNLIIRVQPSGNKSWFVSLSRGKVKKLGNFPKMSLKNAKQASELLLQSKKLRVAILGSGNIGTDLLLKIQRSEYMDCVAFVGRSYTSNGMIKALEMGVICSDKSIQYID